MSNQDTPLHAFDAAQSGDDQSPGAHVAVDNDLLDVRWCLAFCREKQDARRLALRAELDRLRESGAEAEALK